MIFLITLFMPFAPMDMNVYVAKGNISSTFLPFIHIDSVERLEISTSYWAKVEVNFPEKGNYVLTGGKANLRKISFYDENNILIKEGNNISVSIQDTLSKTYYLFYPFVDEKDKSLLTIDIFPQVEFLEKNNKTLNEQLSFHAILVFPLMAAIFFFLLIREAVYAYYALYILSLMFFFGYQYGLLGDILSIINNIPPIWIWFCGFMISIFYLLFSVEFLDLRVHDRFSFKLIKIAIFLTFSFFILSISLYLLGVDVQHSIAYKAPFLAIEIFLILWFILRIIKHPYKIKVYYLTGFTILFIISISGQYLSASQSAADYNYLFQIGLVLEVFILALGLGARVYEIQKEKSLAQKELISQLQVNEKLQNKYTSELEEKVRERTKALSVRNEENEVLLKEIHHRVKNNLQMITSMINMYKRRSNSEEASEVLHATRNKIKSMALIHEHLYSHEDFANVVLHEYISRLVEMLIQSLHKGTDINLSIKIEQLVVDIQTGIYLGLIINELTTNSLKYGLKDHPNPMLSIELKKNNHTMVLIIDDNGTSKSTNHDDGFGFTIIKSILESMNGNLEKTSSASGFRVEISIQDYHLIE